MKRYWIAPLGALAWLLAMLGAHGQFGALRDYEITMDVGDEPVSSGCFRLVNADVIDLYERVPLGTRVVVQP